MNNLNRVGTLFFVFLFPLLVHSKGELIIGIPVIPNSIELNRLSIYEVYLKRKLEKMGVSNFVKMNKGTNVVNDFVQKKLLCVFPIGEEHYRTYYPGNYPNPIFSKSLFNLKMVAFVRKGEKLIKKEADFSGKKIVYPAYYDIQSQVKAKDAMFIAELDHKKRIKMLKKGEVDVLIDIDKEVMRYKVIKDEFIYDDSYYFLEHEQTVMCHKNKKTLNFIKRFNKHK